jgi:hypothetical protein
MYFYPADKIVQVLKQPLVHLKKEKNTAYKKLRCWSDRSKTNVAVATTINHPDIGALKRSIESQRKLLLIQMISNHYKIIVF